jgi:hypothetical protein
MSSRNYENDSARLKRLTQNQRGSGTVPLQQSRSDPRNTGTMWPDAYGVVSHWNLQDQTGTAVVTVSWWASKADYDAGRPPSKKRSRCSRHRNSRRAWCS